MPEDVDKIIRETGITIAALDKKAFSFKELSLNETRDVGYVFDEGVEYLRRLSPKIAEGIARQKALALKFAGIAKATFRSEKDYTFPSTPGSLGVTWLDPATFKWAASPSPSNPCYTSYITNRWDINITADTAAYIMGGSGTYYKGSITADAQSYVLIFKDGLIEYGTTPSIQQFRLISEGKSDYGAYAVPPLVEIPLEKEVTVYQYPTPLGAVPVGPDRGLNWSFMPRRTGTMTLKLLGLVFYEHDFLSGLKSAT